MIPCLRSLVAAFCAVLALAASAHAQGAETVARVLVVQGRATVTRGPAGPPQALAAQAALQRGDTVQTEAGARVRIGFDDQTTITLGELTTLRIIRAGSSAQGGPAPVRAFASSGALRIVSPRVGTEVWTPTAIVAVRGTDWMMQVDPGGTAVLSAQGKVAVSNARGDVRGAVLLTPGEGSDVHEGKAPTPPGRWAPDRIRALERATTLP
jgi:hypothetical protein